MWDAFSGSATGKPTGVAGGVCGNEGRGARVLVQLRVRRGGDAHLHCSAQRACGCRLCLVPRHRAHGGCSRTGAHCGAPRRRSVQPRAVGARQVARVDLSAVGPVHAGSHLAAERDSRRTRGAAASAWMRSPPPRRCTRSQRTRVGRLDLNRADARIRLAKRSCRSLPSTLLGSKAGPAGACLRPRLARMQEQRGHRRTHARLPGERGRRRSQPLSAQLRMQATRHRCKPEPNRWPPVGRPAVSMVLGSLTVALRAADHLAVLREGVDRVGIDGIVPGAAPAAVALEVDRL